MKEKVIRERKIETVRPLRHGLRMIHREMMVEETKVIVLYIVVRRFASLFGWKIDDFASLIEFRRVVRRIEM